MSLALIASWGYFLYENNKLEQFSQEDSFQITKVTEEKSQIQKNFDITVVRLDSLTGNNNGLQAQLTVRNSELSQIKKLWLQLGKFKLPKSML